MMTVILMLLAVVQIDVTSALTNLPRYTSISTTTEPSRECIEGQCSGNQKCVEGTCQCVDKHHYFHAEMSACFPRKGQGESCMDLPKECNSTLTCIDDKCDCNKGTEFYHQDMKLCLQRKVINESCKGYPNECANHATCIKGRCVCDPNSGVYNSYTRSCTQDFSKGVEVRLLNTSLPVVKGEQVNLLCRLNVIEDAIVTWYFNSRRIGTNSTKMFNFIFGANKQEEPPFFYSVLTIYRFRKSLTGTYTCKIRLKRQRNDAMLANVSVTRDMFVVPEVYLEPPYLYVDKGTSVSVHCNARQIDFITFRVDGISSETIEVKRSQDKFIIESYSFEPQATSHVQCVGQLAREGQNFKVTSNKVVINILSEEDITCPASEDRRGVKWKIAKAPSVMRGDCPKAYSGYSTRECDSKGKWKKTNFTNCLKKDLEEIGEEELCLDPFPKLVEDRSCDGNYSLLHAPDGTRRKLVEMLEEIDPSEEAVENITSKLAMSTSEAESMLLSDVSQTVDILANVSNTLSKDESDKALVSTTSLENIADVTDWLLSTNQSEWENLDQPEEIMTETRKGNRMGAKLLMAMDNLAVASLKESKISSRPIIKRNIVIKRNQAESNSDIHFPEKSDTEVKELEAWMTGSQNALFLPHAALPVSAEKIRYSVLLYKGIRQRMSSLDEGLENKEVQSNIMAFSLNKKMKRLTSGLELTFGVPTDNFSEPVCGYLDTSASELGIWSTEGCTAQQLKSGLVKCTCNHLTNFAVLMSPSHIQSSTHNDVLSIISICGCTISIISLLAFIVIYGILWRFMKKDRKTYLHLALSISLLLVYVIFLAGVERSSHEPDCMITAGVLHYLLLAVFCLMLCEGVEVLLAVLYVFPSSFSVWRLLLPAFGAPLLIVGITLAITQAEDYHRDDLCWLSLSSGTLWAFVVPSLAVILVNFIVMCITLRILLGSTVVKGKDSVSKAKMALKSVAVLSPVLGLTWLFGILSINSYTLVFQYLFALCNTLQGFAIFFFYCLSFYQVKDAFKVAKRKHRGGISETETPSSSKSRVRDALNIFNKKQKGSYNVENAAFLSTQPKTLSEETNYTETTTAHKYEVNPMVPTTSQISCTNDVYRMPSAVTEQESVFMETDILNEKDTGGISVIS